MQLLQPRRFHPVKAAWVLACLLAFALYTAHRDRPRLQWGWTGETMGSTYTVKLVEKGLSQKKLAVLRSEVEICLEGLNREMSTWLPDSEISRFNAHTSTAPFAVSADFAEVVRRALEVSRRSGGAFDVTFSPIFNLWGFGASGPKRVPSPEEIAAVRPSCGFELLSVTDRDELVKARPDVQVVLNALTPGYAADRLMDLVKAHGWTNAYVDVGGETVASGRNLQGEPWRIGIERPLYDAAYGAESQKIVHLADRALATSGDYRNYVRGSNATVYAHIFDPRVGQPSTSHVASVSVLAPEGVLADALSTTLFVMGPDEGLQWITNMPGAEAFFIVRKAGGGFEERSSQGFAAAAGWR